MNTEGQDTGKDESLQTSLSLADRWIISKLQKVEADVAKHFNQYRFDLAANSLYEFTWNEYCDWYLELVKPILNSNTSTKAEQRGTRQTLVSVLETILRLLHPITPYITEEAWQSVAPLAGKTGKTIMLQPYPESNEALIDPVAERELEWVKQFIMGVRKIRSEMDIAPSKKLDILLANLNEQDQQWLSQNKTSLTTLAKLNTLTQLDNEQSAPESAVTLVGEMKILIPMAGLIDKTAELNRLNKEIQKLEADIQRVTNKLSNESFIAKAPEAVVEKEKLKLVETEKALSNLKEQYEKISQI